MQISEPSELSGAGPEQYRTQAWIAGVLGIPVFKIRRAAKAGDFPTYHIANSRRLHLLSEVIAAINASRSGGAT